MRNVQTNVASIALALIFFVSMSFGQTFTGDAQVEFTSEAQVEIARMEINAKILSEMNFGLITLAGTGSAVQAQIQPQAHGEGDGNASVTGGEIDDTEASQLQFVVWGGEDGTGYTVTLPETATLENPPAFGAEDQTTATMEIGNFAVLGGEGRTMSTANVDEAFDPSDNSFDNTLADGNIDDYDVVSVGAVLGISGDQRVGTYTGDITVMVEYN
ncbi:DUF4402 domain-containing protein [Chitinivibrio alkaliphilus]|uniref:DUF4402 domain-containing protein n=1 Tax=Chitinivibrio alkaliphilus ACht1 TaxID=1313304 RepID=U7D8H0_9BACT|nr:DUF4402 domain-containing protein [Chitinivibrio alkaliphilus]ERP38694.1 hypothetical protein CALK_0711 [Chitinivibrio alkaliphilus ACht1]